MSEREHVEHEAEARGWSARRGGDWTSFARNEFRLAVDWSQSWQATGAELSISGGTTVARRTWRSSSISPGEWVLNLLRAPLISETEEHDPGKLDSVLAAQQFIDAVSLALCATAASLTRLSHMLGTCTPRIREHLTETTLAYTTELDQEIRRYYLDTPTASAVARLRDLMEESRQ